MNFLVAASAVVLVAAFVDGFLEFVAERDRTVLERLYPVTLIDRLDSGVFTLRGPPESPGPDAMMSGCNYPSDLVVRFLKSFQNSCLVLTHGKHDVEVPTHSKPLQVWVAEVDQGSMQVCQGRGNMFGVTYLESGFVVHADVNTDHAEVRWEAIF